MKNSLFITLLALTFINTVAYGQGNIVYASVPFQNVSLNPQDTLQVTSFVFGNFHEMMCYENFNQTFQISWPYQGTTQTLPNPSNPAPSSLFLSRDASFAGFPIDPSGYNTLLIKNIQNVTITVNCQFTV